MELVQEQKQKRRKRIHQKNKKSKRFKKHNKRKCLLILIFEKKFQKPPIKIRENENLFL